MRRIRTLLSLVAASVAVGTASLHAQLVERVGMTTAQWKYSIDGTDQYAAGFPTLDDTAWPSSTALFGNDGGYPYPFVIQFNGPGGNPAGPLVGYYRTRFNWVGSTAGVVFTMTNYLDDGNVIYLNGTEIQRYNMNGAPPFNAGSLATAANPAGEGVAIIRQAALDALTNGNANPLIAGENILAVAVFQNGSGSSDHAFGLSVHSSQVIPPQITPTTPADITAIQCRNAAFTVTQVPGSGVPAPTIQWFRNVGSGDEELTGEIGSSLTISNVQPANAGQYWAVLSNPGNVVPSRRAVLTVTPDTQGPQVVSVVFEGGAENMLVVTYNEPVQVGTGAGAGDTFNYVFQGQNGHSFTAGRVDPDPNNGAIVRVTGEPLTQGVLYSYFIGYDSEITDACTGFPTPVNTLTGPVLQKAIVLDWNDGRMWRYNQSGADQGTAWREVGFDASSWAEGPQGFGNEGGGFPDAPTSQRTPLTVGTTQNTYYFRTTFRVPAGAQDVRISARVDDGAAIYVNGTEVGRVNIAPTLALAYNTFTPNVFDPENTGYMPVGGILISNSLLVAGDNVLAIELHQVNATSSDVILLTLIEAAVGVVTIEPPQVTQDPTSTTVTEGHSFRLSALAAGSSLTYQWYKVGTPDTAIAGATTSTYTAVADSTSGGGYYVIASNSAGNDQSATATVTLRPVVASYGHVWKYNTESQDGTLAGGTPWYATGFDDTAWPSGPGPLGAETSGTGLARLPAPIATVLPAPSAAFLTAYFRTKVTVPALTAGQSLVLTHYIDDGAAFYVDGVDALRYNLPNALPILSTVLCPGAVPGDSEANLISVPITLSPGEHTIAVEVHQNSATSSDVVFGAELRVISSTAPPLTITKAPPLGVQLTWAANPLYSLFSATSVTGPYTHVLSNPQGTFSVVNATNPASFYRIGINCQ